MRPPLPPSPSWTNTPKPSPERVVLRAANSNLTIASGNCTIIYRCPPRRADEVAFVLPSALSYRAMTAKETLNRTPKGGQSWLPAEYRKSPNIRCHSEPVRLSGVGIPRIEVKATGLGTKMFENSGGLPRQCAHCLAMTWFFDSLRAAIGCPLFSPPSTNPHKPSPPYPFAFCHF